MSIKKFFKNAFDDMAESAAAQHEADVINFEAAKLESRARHAEIKNRPYREQDAARERLAAAQERLGQAQTEHFKH